MENNRNTIGQDAPAQERAASWSTVAANRAVVRRALSYAFGVGATLIAINQGDAILAGRIDAVRILKMALTVVVPYCVSTASSVGAMLEKRPCSPTKRVIE